MNNRFHTIRFALVMTVTACVSGCIDIPQQSNTSYDTITLSRKSVSIPESWSATLFGKNDVTITPQTTGQLMQVCVSEGERVKKGQKLFIIDQRQAFNALETAKANLEAAKAQLSTAQLEYESNRNLYEKKIVSSYMLNTSENDYNRAKAAVSQAEAAVATAELNLEYCTITSPVDGMVGVLPNNPGNQVSPMTQLTTISGNTEMTAKFSISETQLQELLKESDNCDLDLGKLPEMTLVLKDGTVYGYKGKSESISGVVDQYTGSVNCRVTFPNPDSFLFSGMQGTIMAYFKYDDVMIVPLSSILRIQDKTLVYRVKDNHAESVVVTISEIGNGKDAAILEGDVHVGDVIVARGVGYLYDGQQVIFPEEK